VTVSELIEKLQNLPPDLRVFVSGYEGGIDDLTYLVTVSVKLNVNPEHYYGAHEAFDPADTYRGPKYGTPDCEGVVLQ
jgi:hypothetical protein